MHLTGFHHLTAVTAHAPQNLAFYTQTLGLRLVKKTVNQDDTSAYHLFYADGAASPGTDITFFDWPVTKERRGTRSVVRTGFRVRSSDTLHYWVERFAERGVAHGGIVDLGGRETVLFEDAEGQRLALVVDGAGEAGHAWEKSPVPAEHQVLGLGPITVSVPELEPTERVLTGLMNMHKMRAYEAAASDARAPGGAATVHVFGMTEAPRTAAEELHVMVEPGAGRSHPGAGGVHHVAFRTPTFEEYDAWAERLREAAVPASGPVDRYYFRSLYFREPGGILFEIATDGPGFAADEPLEHLGDRLSLPPFLEARRAEIESRLKPLGLEQG
ncbi:MAG TPA: ring-cleaving dioxygenase [Phycisphaerae bacterium]|nr:ring-cleaving dioxygenase [Phycisphaerae bacterium]